jgi:D-aminoacyl-tRNA deacylase
LRALVQRVRFARVTVGTDVVGEIGPGVCVLLGVAEEDSDDEARRLARRVASLRVFENEEGRLDRSVLDAGGAALVVSQFTLIADSKRQKGTRPDFSKAAPKDIAERLYLIFCDALRLEGVVDVQTGVFGARMLVEIANDGPVTIILDT